MAAELYAAPGLAEVRVRLGDQGRFFAAALASGLGAAAADTTLGFDDDARGLEAGATKDAGVAELGVSGLGDVGPAEVRRLAVRVPVGAAVAARSEEHTSEL